LLGTVHMILQMKFVRNSAHGIGIISF
jgi:hypothetical protein